MKLQDCISSKKSPSPFVEFARGYRSLRRFDDAAKGMVHWLYGSSETPYERGRFAATGINSLERTKTYSQPDATFPRIAVDHLANSGNLFTSNVAARKIKEVMDYMPKEEAQKLETYLNDMAKRRQV